MLTRLTRLTAGRYQIPGPGVHRVQRKRSRPARRRPRVGGTRCDGEEGFKEPRVRSLSLDRREVRMQTATRVAIEALLCQTHTDTHRVHVTESSRAIESASTPGGRTGASGWSARLGKRTLSTYQQGGLPGRPPSRREPLDRPRTFFRPAMVPSRWIQGEPRTTRPQPPLARPRSALPAALSAAEGGPERATDRPASAACRSHRAHPRSVCAYRPLQQRPTSARVIHSDDPLAGAPRVFFAVISPQTLTEWACRCTGTPRTETA